MRRVVTAHNADGKSYIASDELADVASLWTTRPDRPIGVASPGEQLQVTRATGETRFFVATIPPSKDPKPDLKNRIGFHRTPGIAYCFVLSGEVVFLVDLQEVKVKTGDLVIERNTMHSWRNETAAPVSMLITVVNAAA
jgi:mannose-6-phosphate isomerase-like protein (cupin superfamily)